MKTTIDIFDAPAARVKDCAAKGTHRSPFALRTRMTQDIAIRGTAGTIQRESIATDTAIGLLPRERRVLPAARRPASVRVRGEDAARIPEAGVSSAHDRWIQPVCGCVRSFSKAG